MSYCRFSGDNWKCDLYCYESADGFVTHVASSRVVGDVPSVSSLLSTDNETWFKAHQTQQKFLESAERVDIGLPYDGMAFADDTLEDFLDRINCLKEAGYYVPGYVIKIIKKQIKEGQNV